LKPLAPKLNQLEDTETPLPLSLGTGAKKIGDVRLSIPAPGSFTVTYPKVQKRNRFISTETVARPPLAPGSVPEPDMLETPLPSDAMLYPGPLTVPLLE
jgi:hypothetical protein